MEVIDLILHQCNERGDNEAEARLCECGYLEADGFPSTGRQQGECITSAEHTGDNLLLQWSERGEAPVLLEDVPDVGLHEGRS